MSVPPPGARPSNQAPPPFEPAAPLLSSLSNDIQKSMAQYESAKSSLEKAAALRTIQAASAKLSRASAPPFQRFFELNFSPHLNGAMRIAIEMGLFESLSPSGSPSTATTIAKSTNATEEFVTRIARVLAAFDVLVESESENVPAYAHTSFSRFLTSPPAKASTRHLFDNMIQAQTLSAGSYYLKNGFKSPEDAKNSPFSFAHGISDAGIFDILESKPERMKIFNDAMMITATLGLKDLVTTYPFDKLEPNSEGIVFVDVGGGKGHVINEMRNVYPNLRGKCALEDMKVVLDGGVIVPKDEVVLQPYDFFKEVQPIEGSNYFLKSILHDWPDHSCLQILKNLVPAMKGHPNSKLFICELVLPDKKPDGGKVLRDMNMMVIGGKERSISQWEALLGNAGFKIIGMHGLNNPNSSIIEAVLVEV